MRQTGAPLHPPYVSDKSTGCSCTYLFYPQAPAPRRACRRPSGPPPVPPGVDVYESASGRRLLRPRCHDAITRAAHDNAPAPAIYVERSAKQTFWDVTDALRHAFWRFVVFLCPRINPSIALSFWQWRAQ